LRKRLDLEIKNVIEGENGKEGGRRRGGRMERK
jgi:hypothetical protein